MPHHLCVATTNTARLAVVYRLISLVPSSNGGEKFSVQGRQEILPRSLPLCLSVCLSVCLSLSLSLSVLHERHTLRDLHSRFTREARRISNHRQVPVHIRWRHGYGWIETRIWTSSPCPYPCLSRSFEAVRVFFPLNEMFPNPSTEGGRRPSPSRLSSLSLPQFRP